MPTPTLHVTTTISPEPSTTRGDSVKVDQATSMRKNGNAGGRSFICTGQGGGSSGFGTSKVAVSKAALARTKPRIMSDGTGRRARHPHASASARKAATRPR
jgi:hypothetical protein